MNNIIASFLFSFRKLLQLLLYHLITFRLSWQWTLKLWPWTSNQKPWYRDYHHFDSYPCNEKTVLIKLIQRSCDLNHCWLCKVCKNVGFSELPERINMVIIIFIFHFYGYHLCLNSVRLNFCCTFKNSLTCYMKHFVMWYIM